MLREGGSSPAQPCAVRAGLRVMRGSICDGFLWGLKTSLESSLCPLLPPPDCVHGDTHSCFTKCCTKILAHSLKSTGS